MSNYECRECGYNPCICWKIDLNKISNSLDRIAESLDQIIKFEYGYPRNANPKDPNKSHD